MLDFINERKGNNMIHEYLNGRVSGKVSRVLMLPDDLVSRNVSRESDQHFFSRSPAPLCVSGFDGRFQNLNPAWKEMLGWPIREMKGVHRLNYVHPDDHEKTIAAERRLVNGETLNGFENRYMCRNGTSRWLSWHSVPDPARREVLSVVRDVSDQKRREKGQEILIRSLKKALRRAKILHGMLPICSNCKKIRDDQDKWHHVETYLRNHTEADFTHGVCPGCMKELYPEMQARR